MLVADCETFIEEISNLIACNQIKTSGSEMQGSETGGGKSEKL